MAGMLPPAVDGSHLVPLARILATLDGPGAERQLQGVLGVLSQQLDSAPPLSEAVFMEMLCGVQALLARGSGGGSDGGGAAAAGLAEEVRVAGWDCLRVLLSRHAAPPAPAACRALLRNPRLRLRLGHVVSLGLDAAAATGAGRELRGRGVAAVTELWRAVDDADTLACFFPGVASALCKTVTGCADARQNHVLTCAALDTFAKVCEATLGDDACATAGLRGGGAPSPLAVVEGWRQQQLGEVPAPTADALPEADQGPGEGIDEDGRTYQYPRVVRDRKWLADTSVRVCRLLGSALQHTARHDNWRVRASAVKVAERLLCTCTLAVELTASSISKQQQSVGAGERLKDGDANASAAGEEEDSLGALLCDTILGSLFSDSPQVAVVAREALRSVRAAGVLAGGSAGGLVRDARRRLHGLCTEARRAMRQADDSRKRATLLLLCGYLYGATERGTEGQGSRRQEQPLSPTLVRRVLGVLLGAVALHPLSIGAVEKNLHSYRAIATAAQQQHAALTAGDDIDEVDGDESGGAGAESGGAGVSQAVGGGMGLGRLSGASGSARWGRRYLHFDDDGVEAALRRATKLLYLAAPAGMVLDMVMSGSRGEDVASDGMGEAAAGAEGNAMSQSLLLGRQAAALVLLDYLVTPHPAAAAPSAASGAGVKPAAGATAGAESFADLWTQPPSPGRDESKDEGDVEEHGMEEVDGWISVELVPMCSWLLQDVLAAAEGGCAVATGSRSGDEWLVLAPLGVVVGSLAVDCVGKLALVVGGEAFAPLLMHCMYPLLERVSDESAEVSDAALRGLVAVAQTMRRHSDASKASGGSDPQAVTPDEEVRRLLMANIDYIVDVICARLRYLHEHPTTPQVLQAVLAFTGTAVLPYIHDTLETLFECVEISEERFLINFFDILRAVMDALLLDQSVSLSPAAATAVAEAGPAPSVEGGQAGATVQERVDADVALLQEYIDGHFKWISHDDYGGLEETDEAAAEPTPEHAPDSSPALTSVMATRILECCQHFVAGKGLRLKLIVFEVMASCIRYLGRQMVVEQVEVAVAGQHRPLILSDFLPTIATLWTPFCRRLSEQSDSDAPALVAATRVITEMSFCCGDFIARRFHDEAWPHLARYLSRYLAHRAAATASSTSASALARHGFTRQYKVIEAALGAFHTSCFPCAFLSAAEAVGCFDAQVSWSHSRRALASSPPTGHSV